MKNMTTKTDEQIAQQYDAFLERANWIGNTPSADVIKLTHDVLNDMIYDMWMEYLSFTEGIATEVYDIPVEAMIEHMGAVSLVDGFCSYLKGALDVHNEVTLEKK
tara:strand:+ start:50 stop:364 length:315 start_codon:yes stop_codon:yes gene_type:complete